MTRRKPMARICLRRDVREGRLLCDVAGVATYEGEQYYRLEACHCEGGYSRLAGVVECLRKSLCLDSGVSLMFQKGAGGVCESRLGGRTVEGGLSPGKMRPRRLTSEAHDLPAGGWAWHRVGAWTSSDARLLSAWRSRKSRKTTTSLPSPSPPRHSPYRISIESEIEISHHVPQQLR